MGWLVENPALPLWMIYAGSVAGLFVAGFQIFEWIHRLTRFPKLDIRLTKEVFFRLLDDGETIFTNAVLIARHGPIEIKNIKFNLKKISGSKKDYIFAPRHIGNKVANPPNPYATNNFLTKSCKTYLAENVPTHMLFLSSLEEYSDQFKNCTDVFISEVNSYQSELQNKLQDIKDKEEEYLQEINIKLSEIESKASASILKFVQLEPGEYELTAIVEYSRISVSLLKKEGEASSKVTFSVEGNFVAKYQGQLGKFLEVASRNILYNRENTFTYPEYQPQKIYEV